MRASELVRFAIEKDGFAAFFVYGPLGCGKTSYALHVAREVYGSWEKAMDHLFFEPQEAIGVLGKSYRKGERVPLIILDDAGFWLDRTSWWEEDKIAFMRLFNLMRSLCAGLIFTTPSAELPRQIMNKVNFRVSIVPIKEEDARAKCEEFGVDFEALKRSVEKDGVDGSSWCLAKGYRLAILPSMWQQISRSFVDIFPMHYPLREVYNEKRRKAVLKGLTELERELKEKERAKKEGKKKGEKEKRGDQG